MRRVGVAIGAGILVGGVAALIAGLMFDPFELVGKWGVVNGLVLGVLAFLLVLVTGRGWLAIAGRWLLVLVLAGACWWTLFFALGTSPLTLEGAWLWPTAVLSVGALVTALRWAWRSARPPSQAFPAS